MGHPMHCMQEEMSESSGQEGGLARGSAARAGSGEDEPERERRYATRQATAARRRSSYNPALDLEKVLRNLTSGLRPVEVFLSLRAHPPVCSSQLPLLMPLPMLCVVMHATNLTALCMRSMQDVPAFLEGPRVTPSAAWNSLGNHDSFALPAGYIGLKCCFC